MWSSVGAIVYSFLIANWKSDSLGGTGGYDDITWLLKGGQGREGSLVAQSGHLVLDKSVSISAHLRE